MSGYIRYGGAPVAVVIDPAGERTLVVARFELAAAEADAGLAVDAVVPYGADDFLDPAPVLALAATCRSLTGTAGVAVAAGADFWAAVAPELQPAYDVEADLVRLRYVKDDDELDRIRAAVLLSLEGQRAVEALAADERTEIELFTVAFAAAQEAAGEPIEFVGALGAGVHTSLIAPPTHVPGTQRVASGTPILSDVAVRHRGYWGDSTRMFGGDEATVELRATLSRILEQTASDLRPGRSAADVFAGMHAAISRELPGAAFPHHGGHGIGIGVGEDPQIIPANDAVIEAGMVFAIEPGAYWHGTHGGRVENTYVVRGAGAELLS